ncbi:MAG TPA: molybdate ABC transporter substrate-binding protein [bacterium]
MKTAAALLLAVFALTVARPASAADPALVSAALSLKAAFTEIGALVASAAGGPPAFNFGASGDLVAQIRGGAPVDVFASASPKDMDDLERSGMLRPGSRVDFAANELVLVVPAGAGGRIARLADLAAAGVARVAVGNAATVPAGRYAAEVLASAGLTAALQPKLVPAENVRQILEWVARGDVDAGMVYATDAMTRPGDVSVAATAPADSHQPIVYPVALLASAPRPDAGRAFIAAVLSPAGRAVLARHGFKPAVETR